MSVLFIDARSGGDFTLDAVFAGLTKMHGNDGVIDFGPCTKKHREGIPQKTGDIEKDYGAERRSLGYSPGYEKQPILKPADINKLLAQNKISRIFIDEREESYIHYLQLGARHFKIPVVVIAGHDKFWNVNADEPTKILEQYYGKNFEALFIDNWRESYDKLALIHNVYPMSYATNFDHLWEVGKRDEFLKTKLYDICFLGYNSHGARPAVTDHIAKKYGHLNNCLLVEKRPNVMDTFIRKDEYFKKMAQSRICLNLRGGAECRKALRFYEIPYVGSYMLSQTDEARQVNKFVGGVHCDYFSDLRELDQHIDWALANETQREFVASRGHQHSMQYHTALSRVEYMYFRIMNG